MKPLARRGTPDGPAPTGRGAPSPHPAAAHAAWNLARFDLASIRLALGCLHTGSLSAAAARSHMALAAASRRLRELERHLGSPLFERHARGLLPTPSGRIFARHATDLLHSMERMGTEIADLQQGISRHLRVWSSTAAIHQFLPPLLARYGQVAPAIRIDLEEQVSEVVAQALRDGRADVGIFVDGTDAAGLECRAFATDELVLVLPAGHRLGVGVGAGAIAFDETLDEPYVSLASGAALLQRQLQSAVAAGRSLRLQFQVRSLDAACQMVAHGLGVALLPRATVQPWVRTLRLTIRPLADTWAKRQILVAVRSGQKDTAIRALADFFVDNAVLSQNAKARRSKQQ